MCVCACIRVRLKNVLCVYSFVYLARIEYLIFVLEGVCVYVHMCTYTYVKLERLCGVYRPSWWSVYNDLN